MGVLTLRPDTNLGYYGISTSAGAHPAVIADDTDTTWVWNSATNPNFTLGFTTATVPAGAYIQSVVPRIRWLGSVALSLQITSSKAGSVYDGPLISSLSFPPMGYTTQTAGGITTKVFTDCQNEVDRLQLFLYQYAAPINGQKISEVYLDVTYNLPIVVSAIVSAGYTVTSRPSISWTNTDPELDPQEKYRVRVFSAAQYGIGGFDPSTSPNTWDSGEVSSSVASAVIGTDLAIGATYKAYVQASDLGSLGRYSAWVAGTAFTMSAEIPAVPAISAVTLQPTIAAVQIDVQGQMNILSNDDASLETTIGTWANSTNGTVARDVVTAAVNGIATLKVTSIAAGDFRGTTAIGTLADPVVAGKTYTISAKARPAATARNVMMNVNWYNAAGTFISNSASASTATTSGTYTTVSFTAAAPALAAFAALTILVIGAAAGGEVFNFDQMGIYPGSTWSRGGLTDSQTYNLQRSYDAGVTWEVVPLASSLPLAIASGQATTFMDYTSKPNSAVIYRANSVGIDGVNVLTSAWSASSGSVTPTSTVFWLKNPANPSNNLKVSIAGDLDSASTETQGLFQAIGRTRAVVISGDIYGEQFNLPLAFYTEADWLTFEALRKAQVTILLQSDTTQQWWIRLGPERQARLVNRTGRKVTPYRQVQIAAVEVDSV